MLRASWLFCRVGAARPLTGQSWVWAVLLLSSTSKSSASVDVFSSGRSSGFAPVYRRRSWQRPQKAEQAAPRMLPSVLPTLAKFPIYKNRH